MPSNAYPPLFSNTSRDQGAPPVVLGYIGASITILVSAIRVGLTIKKQHELRGDDYSFLVGALLAVVASVLLERAVDEGLGRHADTLMPSQLDAYSKLIYATSLTGIAAQAAAKLSVAFLYERLAPRQDRRGIAILLSVVGVWIVVALFGTAFACGVQLDYGASCPAGGWVDVVVLILNFLTDLMLAVWMIPRLWKLQARLEDRVLPIMLMGSRVMVCIVQLGQLGVLGHLSATGQFDDRDETWKEVTFWTIAISVVHLSIITATIPRINSFIADVQTRQAGLALTQKDYDSYVHGKSGGGSNNQRSKDGSKNWSRKDNNSRNNGVLSSFRPDNTAEQRNECRGQGDEIELDVRDNIETGSQSSLSRNAVYQKTEFKWEEEYTAHRRI